jgi:hypothetical protein
LRGVDRAESVDWTAEAVDHAAEYAFSDRNVNSAAGVEHRKPAGETLRGFKCDGTNHARGVVLHNLDMDGWFRLGHEQRVYQWLGALFESHVQHGTYDTDNVSGTFLFRHSSSSSG